MMNKPKALQRGDKVGLVAPASPVDSKEKVALAVDKLGELGFQATVGDSCLEDYGYLSGSDEIRAGDLNYMFADDNIQGIICLRGGYGTPRILDKLDYPMIRKHPKVFVGYSDITALHVAFNQLCKLVTFHGPMPTSDMLTDFDDFSRDSFLQAITCHESLGVLENPPVVEMKSLVGGRVAGSITGGNLSLLTATLGTPFEIDTRDKLFLIEDVDEQPYRIDRMLTQLKLAGKFDDCNGILLGDWHNCEPATAKPSLSLLEIFQDIIVPSGKPTIYNLQAGHCSPKITIPFGVEACLDADNCTLVINECAVK